MWCFALIYQVSTVMHLCFVVVFDVAEGCCVATMPRVCQFHVSLNITIEGCRRDLLYKWYFVYKMQKRDLVLGYFALMPKQR